MRVSFVPVKRERALSARGLDLADAAGVLAGRTFEVEDTRRDNRERHIICYGLLVGRMEMVAYCQHEHMRHVFSMRKANDRERARYATCLEIAAGAG